MSTTLSAIRKLVTILAIAVVLGTFAPYLYSQPATKLTPAQWQEDLRFMAEHMERQHPDLYRRVKKEDFDAEVRRLNNAIPRSTDDEIMVGLMRIAALVQDGHTGAFPPGLGGRPAFPVLMHVFEDGLFIRSAPQKYATLVGARVTRIGNVDAAEALQRVFQIAPAENEMGRLESGPRLLAVPLVLSGTKINTDPNRLKLVVQAKGSTATVEVAAEGTVAQLARQPEDWLDAGRGNAGAPLYLRDPTNAFWFEHDRERKIVYVQQNQIANKRDESVAQFYKRVLEIVAHNEVHKLIIDLRHNGGGNNGLNRAVVLGLIKSKIDERGKLFVITGRRTFSAAQNFVSDLENLTNAIFVGEPTAGRPNHYGDARAVELPNSKVVLRVSTIYWQDVDPRDNRPWTAPEIAAPLSFSEYANGVDPAMKAILEYQPGSGVRDLIRTAADQKEITPVLTQIERSAREPRSKYVNVEADVNRLGYDLLRRNRAADAVLVFRLNARMHPTSANVHDSLGDGLQAAGDKDEAIKAYSKALSIDPNYASSIEALRRLRGQ